ncbi:pyridoxamine 5'-phosphate oxidase family protein [Rhodococcus rhodnii]|uniref:Uncharacterized protein n=2 Tax=Rhodococcus rhodnii TaxID=38312 RepID=R7WR28_9NOCA|nr:pyridoxamine 5'-phosphate oxidase family protein [Rhodococcus rhodnii]EOM77750.1 hypothetical protein Rrhod_0902 [Rhodococcus rhodnii LMG 5362]TXG89030.1 pyridoxamine 5'-phosphate oxidase family protein [Rhodococcus rhodnii]
MALSSDERQQFLAEPRIATIAVARDSTSPPLAVPIWYQYTPGGRPWILTGAGSVKDRAIARAGSFTLAVETLEPSVRYVSVEGRAVRRAPGTTEMLREMAARYLPAEILDGYVEMSLAEHGDQVRIELEPTRWYSADLGAF